MVPFLATICVKNGSGPPVDLLCTLCICCLYMPGSNRVRDCCFFWGLICRNLIDFLSRQVDSNPSNCWQNTGIVEMDRGAVKLSVLCTEQNFVICKLESVLDAELCKSCLASLRVNKSPLTWLLRASLLLWL